MGGLAIVITTEDLGQTVEKYIWRIFFFREVAGLQGATLIQNQLFCRYLRKILSIN